MSVSARPHNRLLAAVLTAGVVSAAPAVTANHPLPVPSTATVQLTSAVTDVLANVDAVVGAAADVWDITSSGALALPFNVLYAAVSAVADPAAGPSLLSNLVQQYLNPAYLDALDPYAEEFADYVLAPLAKVLPAPLGTRVGDAIDAGVKAIGDAMDNLPDPAAGLSLVSRFTSRNDLGRLLFATQFAIYSPFSMVGSWIGWLGGVPVNLESSIESAMRDPSEIPGLVSYLAYDVLDPAHGLLGKLVLDAAAPFFLLPGPIGDNPVTNAPGWARSAYRNFTSAATRWLKQVLPTPVTPTPFGSTSGSAVKPAAAITSRADASATHARSERLPVAKFGASSKVPQATGAGSTHHSGAAAPGTRSAATAGAKSRTRSQTN